ncbi:MAG: hypothetical protein ACRESZ_06675 [Methylococcales bacterium]
MKSFSMKYSGLAFAAAITGAMLAPAAEAVNLATDGIGEVAIMPYYTVRNGWVSLINITNTAGEAVVVKVRFHESRNSRDVLDINVALSPFDVFTAVLKESKNNSGPVLKVTDFVPGPDKVLDTCVIPHQKSFKMAPAGQLAYSGTNDDDGPQDADRLREGYIEFVSMGHTVSIPGAGLDVPAGETLIGNAIENHWCTPALTPPTAPADTVSVTTAFEKLSASNTVILNTARQFGEPINSLKINYRLINPVRGLEIGGSAVTWANFFNPGARGTGGPGLGVPPSTINVADHLSPPTDNTTCTITRGDERPPTSRSDWDPRGGPGSGLPTDISCMNLITAQNQFDNLEPSLNDAYPVRGNWWDDTLNQVVNVFPSTFDTYRIVGPNALPGYRGVDALSATIQRASIINEWSLVSSLGVSTDWVVTLPTKGFYVDQSPGSLRQYAAIVSGARDEAEYCIQSAAVDGICGATETGNSDVPYPPFAEAFHQAGAAGDRFSAKSCNEVRFARYDRAENTLNQGDQVVPSPAPMLPVEHLCYEANVVTFSTTPSFTSGPLDATDRDPGENDSQILDVSGLLPAEEGWVTLVLDESSSADPTTADGGLEGWSGLPAIGYTVKQRIFPQGVDKNTSSIVDHGYKRCRNQHLDEAGVRCVD